MLDPRSAPPRLMLLLLACLAFARALPAQTIQGTLLDDRTGGRVPEGTVTLLTEDSVPMAETRTDRGGVFVLRARQPGAYRLRAERDRFATVVSAPFTLNAGDTIQVHLLLLRRAVVINPLIVQAPRRVRGPLGEYHERLRRNPWGKFVTREEIERIHAGRATDLLRRMPGVTLEPAARSTGSHVILRGTCRPTILVDGMRIREAGATIDDLVRPSDLEGIEVYRSAFDVPAQYGLDVGCGAILLWTR